jgi:L-ascorbate metabolism protein UlaG (beta-lactamase superfamily)
MRTRTWLSGLLIPLVLGMVLTACGQAESVSAGEVQLTFYGNQHFRLVSPGGKVILINPWIKGNQDAPIDIAFYKKGEVDLILPTAGHGDDMGDTVEIAAGTGAAVFVVGELGTWMQNEIKKFGGAPEQIYSGSLGGRYKLGDITVQMLQSHHGSGIRPPEGSPAPLYGGPAAGFLITFENGLRVLMAGSTALTLDLELFGRRYQPHVAMLPVLGRFMMEPDDAAYAAKLLKTDNRNLKTVIPQHTRFKNRQPWMGTPEQFEEEVRKLRLKLQVLKPEIGKVYSLKK